MVERSVDVHVIHCDACRAKVQAESTYDSQSTMMLNEGWGAFAFPLRPNAATLEQSDLCPKCATRVASFIKDMRSGK